MSSIAQNVTAPTDFVMDEGMWRANMVINSMAIIIGVYVTLALITYQYVRRIRMKQQAKRNSRERRFGTIARILCILVAVLVTLFCTFKLVTLYVEHQAAEDAEKVDSEDIPYNCTILSKVKDSCLILSVFLVYVFLWTRQRVFYIHKALSHLNSRALRFLSYAVLIIWVVYTLSATISLMAAVHYEYKPKLGCTTVVGTAIALRGLLVSFVIVGAFMQISLLVLFIYPIVRRSSRTSENRSTNRVMARVKKAVILSVICVVTDVASATLSIRTFSRSRNSFTSTYVINLTLNMICIVFCFDNWKGMLFPFRRSKNKYKTNSVGSQGGSQPSVRTSNTRSSL